MAFFVRKNKPQFFAKETQTFNAKGEYMFDFCKKKLTRNQKDSEYL